jgi:hypothetical protein
MDTYQLRDVLTRDLGPSFGGVYLRDLLPETLDQKAIVINTDSHDQPSAHWVCVYLNIPVVKYLDSYGLPPAHLYNPHVYQDLNTDVCGQYCVYYLQQRYRSGKTVRDWILPWKGTSLQRDPYVEQWFKDTFRKPRTHKGQICRCRKLNL